MKTKYIYISIIILALLSCKTKNEALETALRLAGDNRGELEKVLHHYSKTPADSLKLKAAEFLIENMPGHYTLKSPLIDEFRGRIRMDTSLTYSGKKVLELFLEQLEICKKNSRKKEDIQHVKADYLIRHIDLSFQYLSTYPWLQGIPFDQFLEHLLPYRFGNESLDLWRDSLHIEDHDLKEIINSYDKTKYTIGHTNRNSLIKFPFIPQETILRIFNRDILKDCNYLVYENQLRAQTLGHPSAMEFLPHYANRNGFHYWHSTFSPEFKYLPAILYSHERKTPKVYRRTYSHNPIAIPSENEYIPELFTDPFCKDVTSSYLHTSNVNIEIKKTTHHDFRHAYLCVFNNLDWQPVAIATANNRHAEFKDMGKGIIYLPIRYQDRDPHPANYPFLLDLKGNVNYLIPDTTTTRTLHLTRKYPTHMGILAYKAKLKDLELTASNNPKFVKSDTIPCDSTSAITHQYYLPHPEKAYRYWCFSNNRQRLLEFADILFVTPEGKFIQGNTTPEHSHGFDREALTNNTLPLGHNIIIDFGSPIEIAKIICIPQSDGNGIYPDNEYELFYHDLNGWQSLGREIATDCYLEYDNVPSGALYWLHNHTTGIEERIFTIENGQTRFW